MFYNKIVRAFNVNLAMTYMSVPPRQNTSLTFNLITTRIINGLGQDILFAHNIAECHCDTPTFHLERSRC